MPKGIPGRPLCSIDGCDGIHSSRGFCSTHYKRWQVTGDPLSPGKVRRYCTVAKCGKPAHGHGYCSLHYRRWRESGDPEHARYTLRGKLLARTERAENGCLLWTGALDGRGYGRFRIGVKPHLAHRLVYKVIGGMTIPEGMTLDHGCHSADPDCAGGEACLHRRCVEPDHMVPMPIGENVLLGRGPSAENARKTHCLRGHPLSGANLRVSPSGRRVCRTCAANYQRDWRARRASR